jgi:prepilin-type N-terminal cleavage/methylation domain-containing protein
MHCNPRNAHEAGFTLVELLVVVALTGVVMSAIYGVVIQTMRTEQYTAQLREVMDDGRVSLDRVRMELREARRVHLDPTCPDAPDPCLESKRLSFWVDKNQDLVQQPDEQVHYCTREIGTSTCTHPEPGKRFELVRWTGLPSAVPEPPADAQIIARTIVGAKTPFVFNAAPPDTSVVTITYVLDTQLPRGPKELDVSATIRLRNVATIP